LTVEAHPSREEAFEKLPASGDGGIVRSPNGNRASRVGRWRIEGHVTMKQGVVVSQRAWGTLATDAGFGYSLLVSTDSADIEFALNGSHGFTSPELRFRVNDLRIERRTV
jgi:hypothetical protein